jgi:hypothetical protein
VSTALEVLGCHRQVKKKDIEARKEEIKLFQEV